MQNIFADINNDQALDFDVIKTKYMDININIEIPIFIEKYASNSSFSLKTPIFIDTKTQKVIFQEAYYIENGKKIFAYFQEDQIGNKYAIFDVNKISGFEYTFYIESRIISENKIIFPEDVFYLNQEITDFQDYKKPTRYINSDKSEIISISNYLKKSNNLLEEVTNIIDWVYNYVEYDISYSDKVVEAVNVLKERKGVCSEFSILAAAILRERGIPTRYVTGYASSSVDWQSHAWLEVYVPNYDWVQVDPTFGEVGLVDASHLMVSRAFDPSEIKDKITAYGDVSLSFGDKETNFKINEHKSFSQRGYSNAISVDFVYPDKIKEGSAFFITSKITNTTNRPLSVLFILSIHDDFKLIYPETKESIIYLEPFKEKEITYYVLAENTNVPINYSKEYTFSLVSQFYDYSNSLSVFKDSGYFQDAFFVTKPLFLYDSNILKLSFDVINYTNTEKNISLDFNNFFESIDLKVPINSIYNFSQSFNVSKNSRFVLNINGDYSLSENYFIFDDKVYFEKEDDILDENISLVVDSNIDENISENKKDNNIWDEIDKDREDSFNKKNNTTLIGIIIISLFIIMIVFIFFLKGKEEIYLKDVK